MREWVQMVERVEPDCWDGGARRLRGWGPAQKCNMQQVVTLFTLLRMNSIISSAYNDLI